MGSFRDFFCSIILFKDYLGLTLTFFYDKVKFALWCFYMVKCLNLKVRGAFVEYFDTKVNNNKIVK